MRPRPADAPGMLSPHRASRHLHKSRSSDDVPDECAAVAPDRSSSNPRCNSRNSRSSNEREHLVTVHEQACPSSATLCRKLPSSLPSTPEENPCTDDDDGEEEEDVSLLLPRDASGTLSSPRPRTADGGARWPSLPSRCRACSRLVLLALVATSLGGSGYLIGLTAERGPLNVAEAGGGVLSPGPSSLGGGPHDGDSKRLSNFFKPERDEVSRLKVVQQHVAKEAELESEVSAQCSAHARAQLRHIAAPSLRPLSALQQWSARTHSQMVGIARRPLPCSTVELGRTPRCVA
jgi:hypothetical protein